MGDAGGEQADGGELFCLGELAFHLGLVGDVVEEDDAADGAEIARDERRDGDVGNAGFFGGGGEAELIEVVDAGLILDAAIFLDEVGGEDGFERLAEGVFARQCEEDFHLRVPALDALFGIDGEDADIDGFDDVLVEFLKALVFDNFLFEAGVEAGILQGDADVAGQRFEELHVLAGEEVATGAAAQADDGDGAVLFLPFAGTGDADATGQEVIHVEQRGGGLLGRREVERLLRIFEEEVRAGGGVVEVEEAEVEFVRQNIFGQAVARGQVIAAGVVGQKNSDAVDTEGAGQAIDDGLEQGSEVSEGAEAAAEGDEGGAVVVALAVEEAIDAGLDESLDGFEEKSGEDNGSERAPDAEVAETRLRDGGDDGQQDEVDAHDGGSGEGVGDAAFENEVDIHHAVAHDGPAEGEREEDHADAGELGERVGHCNVGHVGDGVEQRKGGNGEDGAAGEPLKLLALEGEIGATVFRVEDCCSEEVEKGLVRDGYLIETMPEQFSSGPVLDSDELQRDDHRGRQVDYGGEPWPALAPLGGKCEGKVEEECRLERISDNLAPVDSLVEGFRPAEVPERVEDERGEAEQIKVGGVGRGPASEEDVEADAEIDQGDEAKPLIDAAILEVEDDGDIRDAETMTDESVVNGVVGAGVPHLPREKRESRGGNVVGFEEEVAGFYAGTFARAIGGDALGLKTTVGFDPPDAVGGNLVTVFLHQVVPRTHDGGTGKERQKDGDDAGLKRPGHGKRMLRPEHPGEIRLARVCARDRSTSRRFAVQTDCHRLCRNTNSYCNWYIVENDHDRSTMGSGGADIEGSGRRFPPQSCLRI